MATSIEEVASFLMMFTTKSKMFDMRFRGDRKKNINTLSELEITYPFLDKKS